MASINPTKIAALGFDASFLSSRPLPTAPDGYYDWQVSNNPEDKRDGHSAATNVINRVCINFRTSAVCMHAETILYRLKRSSKKVASSILTLAFLFVYLVCLYKLRR